MTIYEELVKRVEEGESFNVDFEKRTIKIGKTKLINNGAYDNERILIQFDKYSGGLDAVMKEIYGLYLGYKLSLPSERNSRQRKRYFKALSTEELSDCEMATGERRDVAQAKLEGFILCSVLSGELTWNEERHGKWFWQSKNDPDLVILRSWIENN
jgi:hypothetical protein